MNIFIICSKKFYNNIPSIQKTLKTQGHRITLPNSYDNPEAEEEIRKQGVKNHAAWKADMFAHSLSAIEKNDAVLVLNFDKKTGEKNYIGGATFLEMYDAFRLGKKIFLYNPIPEGILRDEIIGFNPVVIDGDLGKIK